MNWLVLGVLVFCAKGASAVEALPVQPGMAVEARAQGDNPLPARQRLRAELENSSYIYNGENSAWEVTRTTLTYLESLFQPSLSYDFSDALRFKAGVGLLVPLNQEQKISRYYPFIQTKMFFGQKVLTLGSLDGKHNFPQPILDPLTSMTPQIRLPESTQIPIFYETFPLGVDSHGRYEYGFSLRTTSGDDQEFYLNWQLPDTADHRERFDAGLILSFEQQWPLPAYFAVHYWHNGGHEDPHVIPITEDYVVSLGLRTQKYSLLYLASYWIPNRDDPGQNVFGQAIFGEYNLRWGAWLLQPQFFVTSQYAHSSQQYISIEGDPFYRVPMYAGLNLYYTTRLFDTFDFKMGFVNGAFASRPGGALGIRYDQMMRVDIAAPLNL